MPPSWDPTASIRTRRPTQRDQRSSWRGRRRNWSGRVLIDVIDHCDNRSGGENENGTGEEHDEQRQDGKRKQDEKNNGPNDSYSTEPTNLTDEEMRKER